MTLREIADKLGIGEYPAAMNEVYASLPEQSGPVCDVELIDSLQQEYELFGKYYEVVREAAQKIEADPVRRSWVRVAQRRAMGESVTVGRSIPMNYEDDCLEGRMMPLMVLLPQIPEGIRLYREKGFPEEQIRNWIGAYKSGMSIVEYRTGKPGLNRLYYNWLNLFAKAMIFSVEGLQFELKEAPANAVFLKNRESGRVVAVMNAGTAHSSGQMLGSAGFEDEEGSFGLEFRETEEAYIGHPVVDYLISPKETVFPKAGWECYIGPGDQVLAIHIPKGADISPDMLNKAIEDARVIVRDKYPQFTVNGIYCTSWILDPLLQEVLRESSKITGLQRRFVLFPMKNNGQDVFKYVFGRKPERLEDLAEDTSLQRKLKKLYMEGRFIHNYGGVIV